MLELPDKPWFRPGEAAKLLGISRSTLKKLLPSDCPRHQNNHRRIPRTFILAHLPLSTELGKSGQS